MLDQKYQGITDELYSMVQALQVGGIALSQKLGNREDIGISQKSLTEIIIRIWEKIGEMTGECYMGFIMKVEPTFVACEGSVRVHVTADSSGSISNFDYIKIYSNGVLKAEGMAVETFDAEFDIDDTSVIECVAVIAGRTFTKQEKVTKYMPFFIGSGQRYQDIMNEECLQDLDGTLEGNYDITVRRTGDHIFIIIPASRKQEFRRADMNGLGLKVEIPMTASEYEGFVAYKSINTYQAGTYNIDIDINS
jgi:predicted DNA-binding transcriptional regulator